MSKVIVVTGTSSGVGYATAEELLKQGNTVIGVSRRQTKLSHVRFHEFRFDLVNDDLNALAEQIKSVSEHLDGLVNNAGALVNKPFQDITQQDLELVYQTNVFAPFRLVQALLPLLKEESHVLNITSMGGFQGASKFPGLSAYASSKSAVSGLTECMAEEFKDLGIKVNALALGAVQTEMLEKAFPGYQAPIDAWGMGKFVAGFVLTGHYVFNGKILPASKTTP